MATTPVAPPAEPSMGDLRAMLGAEAPASEQQNPETVGTKDAPLELPGDKEPQAAPPAEPPAPKEPKEEPVNKQEPKQTTEEPEEELPKGVRKALQKEVAKQAEYDRIIAEARSTTLAKQAEAEKLKGTTGSAPDPNTEPKKLSAPTYPQFQENEKWTDYQARVSQYQTDLAAYLKQEARDEVTKEFQQKEQAETERQAKAKAQAAWDEAIKAHGKEFPDIVESLRAKVPDDEVQTAIGNLEHWHDVVVHLDKNPEALEAVLEQFKVSPYRGVAALGRIEDKLTAPKTTPKEAAPPAKELPEPPEKVGGRSTPAGGQVDLEKVSMSQFKAQVNRMTGKTKG